MADNSGIKFLKYIQKLKLFFLSKDILSFLFFLALSSGFWFFHALGKERETNILIPVRYVGIPLNVEIVNSPPTEISLNIKDQGLRLFDYSNNHLSPLTIDVTQNFKQKGEILINSDQLNSKIKHYLKSTTVVLDNRPDSILLQYERLSKKTVPVKLYSKIEFAHQYMLSDNIKLEPNRVNVFGPKKVLDTLKFVSTELLETKSLKDTTSYICKLKPIRLVHFSASKIKVKVCVEPFTERKVQIPITILNCPGNLSIRTFPAFVRVVYTVGLSHFNFLSQSDIVVYLDYNDLKINQQSKQLLKIKNNTSQISNIRISPHEVEFIMEKK